MDDVQIIPVWLSVCHSDSLPLPVSGVVLSLSRVGKFIKLTERGWRGPVLEMPVRLSTFELVLERLLTSAFSASLKICDSGSVELFSVELFSKSIGLFQQVSNSLAYKTGNIVKVYIILYYNFHLFCAHIFLFYQSSFTSQKDLMVILKLGDN